MSEIHTVEYDDLTVTAAEITLKSNGYTLVTTDSVNDLKPRQYMKILYPDYASSFDGAMKWVIRFCNK